MFSNVKISVICLRRCLFKCFGLAFKMFFETEVGTDGRFYSCFCFLCVRFKGVLFTRKTSISMFSISSKHAYSTVNPRKRENDEFTN